ncbi:MAG: YoaK family protein [Acidimicrobiales bacterium]
MRLVLRSRFWLSAVSGFVNSIGFVVLVGVFLTGATGNAVHVGVALGDELWRDALRFGLPIAGLFGAAAIALGVGFILRRRGIDPRPLMAWGEIALLATIAVLGSVLRDERGMSVFSAEYYVFLLLGVGALGLQYALVHLSGPPERVSTVVVGIHVIHGATSAAHWIDARFRPTSTPEEESVARAEASDARREWADHLGMILCFAAGGWVGIVLERRVGLWALVVPVTVLVALQVLGQHRHQMVPETDTDVSPA